MSPIYGAALKLLPHSIAKDFQNNMSLLDIISKRKSQLKTLRINIKEEVSAGVFLVEDESACSLLQADPNQIKTIEPGKAHIVAQPYLISENLIGFKKSPLKMKPISIKTVHKDAHLRKLAENLSTGDNFDKHESLEKLGEKPDGHRVESCILFITFIGRVYEGRYGKTRTVRGTGLKGGSAILYLNAKNVDLFKRFGSHQITKLKTKVNQKNDVTVTFQSTAGTNAHKIADDIFQDQLVGQNQIEDEVAMVVETNLFEDKTFKIKVLITKTDEEIDEEFVIYSHALKDVWSQTFEDEDSLTEASLLLIGKKVRIDYNTQDQVNYTSRIIIKN